MWLVAKNFIEEGPLQKWFDVRIAQSIIAWTYYTASETATQH